MTRYALDVRFDSVDFVPHTCRVHDALHELPAGGCFEGLIPCSQTLTVGELSFVRSGLRGARQG